SLLHELLARRGWSSGWDLRVTAYTEQSLAAYEAVVGERVERMLGCRMRRGDVRTLSKERNTVERLINELKAWRGIATRYEQETGQLPRRAPPPCRHDLDRRPPETRRLITTSHRL
ncbi:hypothetical protein ACFWU3_36435, partial [Streptomyces sp. NPDC058685]